MRRPPYAYQEALAFLGAATILGSALGALIAALRARTVRP